MSVKLLFILVVIVLLPMIGAVVGFKINKRLKKRPRYNFSFPKKFPKELREEIQEILNKKILGKIVFVEENVKRIRSSPTIPGEWEIQRPNPLKGEEEIVWKTTQEIRDTQEIINHITHCLRIDYTSSG